MDNVFNFNKNKKPKINPDKEIVDKLEYLLKEAKEGKIIALTCTHLSDEKIIHNETVGKILEYHLVFIGMITNLKIDIKNMYEDRNE